MLTEVNTPRKMAKFAGPHNNKRTVPVYDTD